MAEQVNKGLEPAHLAELVVEAMSRKEFYILTDPGRRPEIEKRYKEVLLAVDAVEARLPSVVQRPIQ